MKEKSKACFRCFGNINLDKDRFIVVEDFEGNKSLKKIWFHKSCWNDLMTHKNATTKLQQQAEELFKRAKEVIN